MRPENGQSGGLFLPAFASDEGQTEERHDGISPAPVPAEPAAQPRSRGLPTKEKTEEKKDGARGMTEEDGHEAGACRRDGARLRGGGSEAPPVSGRTNSAGRGMTAGQR